VLRGPELERYEILGELGQGGMSVVYRARDKQLSRLVAVKVLHEFLARQTDARKRFHREAVAVAKLHHPGILEIFDYSGPDAKETYIVTELIEGCTLREHVDKRAKPLYPEIAVLLVAELIRALKHAHEQSVIHRDLKPENVMITKDGQLKLMDFGLAQLMDGGTKLTATGTLLGSPAHMAPEVIDGKMSDARADLFSMGTILYWLTTGKLPFEAGNPSALFKKILDGKYDDPQMLEPKIGNGLARIIQRALEPDPEQRYQDVTEIAGDLEAELAAVEMLPIDLNARRYLSDPDRYTSELGPKLINILTESGKQALVEGNIARAMDRFNRVLAIDPHLQEVLKIVARVGRKKEMARRARQLATFTAISVVAGGVSYGAVKLFPKPATDLPPREEVITSVDPLPIQQTLASTASAPVFEVKQPRVVEELAKRTEPLKKDRRRNEGRLIASAGSELPVRAQADAGVAPSEDAGVAPKPKTASISVRIGGAFASVLEIDGAVRDTDTFGKSYEVTAGRHTLTVRAASGLKREKVLEVDDHGAIFVIDANLGRVPLKGALLIDLGS
jgi:eukaryotic-like serine/threonine-protein kinase